MQVRGSSDSDYVSDGVIGYGIHRRLLLFHLKSDGGYTSSPSLPDCPVNSSRRHHSADLVIRDIAKIRDPDPLRIIEERVVLLTDRCNSHAIRTAE